jgi:integrase
MPARNPPNDPTVADGWHTPINCCKTNHIRMIRIFGERQAPRGKRARVTPHDLRRLFKSIGAEIGIDPTDMNLLVGHTIKGVDSHYLANPRLSVLRAPAQRIADEIDNPQESISTG